MSACSQCGAAARPTDKFCNACGAPIVRASAPAGPPQGASLYGAPPPLVPPPPGPAPFGVQPGRAPSVHCQMGHEISPGASFCSQGHPMALDQMQFSSEAYARQGALGAPPPAAYGQSAATSAPAAPYGTPPPPPFASLPGFGGPALPPYGSNDPTRDPVPPKVLRGFLLAYSTNPSGDFWPLTGGRLLVGRFGSAEGIDIALQDPTISSRHAAIWVDAANGVISVEDTASTNGTFVNDEHIGFNGRRELRDGDRVRFGAYKTIVKVIGRM